MIKPSGVKVSLKAQISFVFVVTSTVETFCTCAMVKTVVALPAVVRSPLNIVRSVGACFSLRMPFVVPIHIIFRTGQIVVI